MELGGTLSRAVAYVEKLPGLDTAAVRDGLILREQHRQLEKLSEQQLESLGLSARRLEVLEALYHHPEHAMSPADLADEVLLTRAGMTSLLDTLEQAGYVERRPHPHDRRMLSVALTPAGRKFISSVLQHRYEMAARVVAVLEPHERAAIIDCQRRLLTAAHQLLAEENLAAPAPSSAEHS